MTYKHHLQTLLAIVGVFCFLSWNPAREYTIEKLGSSINTEGYDEISPIISKDGTTLFFTRIGYPQFAKNLIIEGEDISNHPSEGYYNMQLQWVYAQMGDDVQEPYTSELNQDVWMANSEKAAFDEAIHLGTPINNALPNSVCALTNDGKDMIVINQFNPEGGMRRGFSKISNLRDGTWSNPRPIEIQGLDMKSDDISVSIHSDGRIMVLSLNNKESIGDHDIYISKKIGLDTWSTPIHLGSGINTKHREVAPFLSDDGRTMYFSSNRPGGLGGMDIYYSVRQGQGWKEWSEPRKFYYPINTKHDDSQPRFNKSSGYLYFSSKRDGSSDIFRAKIEEPAVLNYAFETVEISGRVLNKGNNMPIGADVQVVLLQENKVFSSDKSTNGQYRLNIPKGMDVEVRASLDGFISHAKHFSFQTDRQYQITKNIDLFIEPIRKGKNIGHSPIYFDRSSSKFQTSALPELRRLAQLLKANSNVNIEIQGHTDNIGDVKELTTLSLKRANAVRAFFLGQGVAIERIAVKGLGPNHPITTNVDEKSRSKNRRVEIKVAQISETTD